MKFNLALVIFGPDLDLSAIYRVRVCVVAAGAMFLFHNLRVEAIEE